MNKINEKAFNPIDPEEKDLMESIERDEWQPVKDFDRERKKAVLPVWLNRLFHLGFLVGARGFEPPTP